MTISAAIAIARNEFRRVITDPITILIGAILFILTFANAAEGYQLLELISTSHHIDGLLIGYSQIYFVSYFICGILVAFLGMTAISEDRFKGTFNVLLAKPIYRRDIIIGKFLGLSIYILLFLTVEMALNYLVLLNYYGAPLSMSEVVIRVFSYIIVLSISLSVDLGIAMLIGILFKNRLMVSSAVVTYVSYEWFWLQGYGNNTHMLKFMFSPYIQTNKILFTPDLLDTSTQFSKWLNHALPNITIMITVMLALLLINCFAFIKTDDI